MDRKILITTIMLGQLPCLQLEITAHTRTIIMGGQYNDPSKGNLPNHRIPIPPIYIYQDGNNLLFNYCITGEPIKFVKGHTLLYTTTIKDEGSIEIPQWIIGKVEIRLTRGNITYHASIEL